MLEGQLQCDLQASRCLRWEARRRDLAEVAAGQIRVRGICKLRCVGCVEGLSSKLQANRFGKGEIFEDRRIEIVEAGATRLLAFATQWGVVRLADLRCCGRVRKRSQVEPPVVDMRSSVDILSLDYVREATKSRCGRGAVYRERLTALIGVDEVKVPSAQHSVFQFVCAGAVHPPSTIRYSPRSREVHQVSCICVAECIVCGDPEAWQPLCAVLLIL